MPTAKKISAKKTAAKTPSAIKKDPPPPDNWKPGRPCNVRCEKDPRIFVPVDENMRKENPRKATRLARLHGNREAIRRRARGWESSFTQFLNERADMTFAWGSNDCMTFAGDAVTLYGFPDPMEDWRGSYSTVNEAAELLNEKPDGLLGWATEVFSGYSEIRTGSAKRGDVVLLEFESERQFGTNQTKWMMGVCDGSSAVVLADQGIEKVPMSKAIKAWAIGHA